MSPALARPLASRARGDGTLPLQAGLSRPVPRTRDPGRAGGRAVSSARRERPSPPHSPVPACPRWSAQDGMQRQQTGCRCPETRVLSWARATQHRSQTAQEPEHPPHPPLLNFNRRAVNSPLNPQKPIRAGAAAASQSQCPPPPGPRPLSRDSCRQTKLETRLLGSYFRIRSSSRLPLLLLCAELPALPLCFLRPLVASEERVRAGGNVQRRLRRVRAERAPPSGCC